MAYKHGVYVSEVPTSILPAVVVDSALPVIFGTAPVNMTDPTNVNKPVLCNSYEEFVAAFGFVPAADDSTSGLKKFGFSLCEAAYAQFALFGVAPAVFVNVLDPTTHKKTADTVSVTLDAKTGSAVVTEPGIILSSVTLTNVDSPYTVGTDYELSFDDDGNLVVTSLSDDDGFKCLVGSSITFAADKLDPSAVEADDVIGGVSVSGEKSGLELVAEVYSRFRLVPGTITAPGFSGDPEVAAVMAAKCVDINDRFKAMCVIDVPTDTATDYTKVPSWKTTNNVTDKHQIVCWPMLSLSGTLFHMSSQVAALMGLVDSENNGTPYVSPSNHTLQTTATVLESGKEVWLGFETANYLNGQGICTAINEASGWVFWGNRTGVYPGSSDPKDTFIPIRRMMNWIGNSLITTYWQRLDAPLNRRLIDTVVDSANLWLNGLAAQQYILRGSVGFRESENSTTDLLDGIAKFHVLVSPPPPARDIEFVMEYDAEAMTVLFE